MNVFQGVPMYGVKRYDYVSQWFSDVYYRVHDLTNRNNVEWVGGFYAQPITDCWGGSKDIPYGLFVPMSVKFQNWETQYFLDNKIVTGNNRLSKYVIGKAKEYFSNPPKTREWPAI